MRYLFTMLILFSTLITLFAQNVVDINKNEILKVRTASNLAIKNHEVKKVIACLTEDINIAASNGEIFSGKIAFKEALTNIFKTYPDLYFVRNAEEVLINTENTVAWEKGTWIALRPQTDHRNNYGGSYSAYWVKIAGVWKIKSELFVRLY